MVRYVKWLAIIFLIGCMGTPKLEKWESFCQSNHTWFDFLKNLEYSGPNDIKPLIEGMRFKPCRNSLSEGLVHLERKIEANKNIETPDKILLNVGLMLGEKRAEACFDALIEKQKIDTTSFFKLAVFAPNILFKKLDFLIVSYLKSPTSVNKNKLSILAGDLFIWIEYIHFLKTHKDFEKMDHLHEYYLSLKNTERETLRPFLKEFCEHEAEWCLKKLESQNETQKEYLWLKVFENNRHPRVIAKLIEYSENHPEMMIRLHANNILESMFQKSGSKDIRRP